MLNSDLIKGERPRLSSRLFYEPRSQYIANQSWSAKETVIDENINVSLFYLHGDTKQDFD